MFVSGCARRTSYSKSIKERATGFALRLSLVAGVFAGNYPVTAQNRSIVDAQVQDIPAVLNHTMHIRRDANGSFIANVQINGIAVRVIIDTGSQGTILSVQDARNTGADQDITSSQTMAGIGGYTRLNLTHVRSMDVGGQQLGGFSAMIGQAGIPYTLLGQTEINRLGRIVIEDGTMTITPR